MAVIFMTNGCRLLVKCWDFFQICFILPRTDAADSAIDGSHDDAIGFSSFLAEAEPAQDDTDDGSKPAAPSDPIKWFGILTPPALRASQNNFKEAVSCVLSLATVASKMKQTEIEVRRTRKKLTRLP